MYARNDYSYSSGTYVRSWILAFAVVACRLSTLEAAMPTVLVVEDDFLVRDLVSEELQAAGFSVLQAGDADAAVLILETRNDVYLVFTDIDMPGSMDGLRLAAAVRHRWPPVHIIITSGKLRPLTIPANAMFIPKPYLGRVVVSAMRTFENMR
jgi:CheY-like chemotaxis protein